jgi:hypothetical protein
MELLQCENNIGLVERQSISKATSQIATKIKRKFMNKQLACSP